MWKKGINISILIFLLSLIYAVIRYNFLRDVPYSEIPLFISNKATALSSTVIIGFSFLLGPLTRMFPNIFEKNLSLRKSFGLIGFGLASIHAIISLILLSPEYYGKFYTQEGLINTTGQFSLLFGVLALAVFSIVSITSLPSIYKALGEKKWKTVQRFGYIGYFAVLLHVVVMGFKGWLNPSSYAYGFISITLVSSLFIIFVLLMRIVVMFKKN